MIPSFNLIPLVQAFGWMVAHSLWQIALVWLLFKCFMWRLNHRHQMVYMLALTAMLLSAIWSGATFWREYDRLQTTTSAFVSIEMPSNELQALSLTPAGTSSLSYADLVQVWLENHSAAIGWAWMLCAGVLWLRLMGGWILAQRLRRRNVRTAAREWQVCCETWAKTLKINKYVRLLESPYVSEPLTIGFWKPVILFPVGLLLQLSPPQVEALFLHELAHIRRHDYLINLFQLVLEVCFFYHPLFWLLSREARSRREFCCDEVVLKHVANPLLYAQTLTNLQLSILKSSNQFVMNATGKSRFTERILHIAGIAPKRAAQPNWTLVMMLPVLIALSSWWPARATQVDNNSGIENALIPGLDSTAPRPAVRPTPARSNKAMPATDKVSVSETDAIPPKLDSQQTGADPGPAGNMNAAVEAVKMNVLYIGVDNPLKVVAAGVPSSALTVQLIGEGSIQGANGEYVVRVSKPGIVTIRVTRQSDKGVELVKDQVYRVKRVPEPVLRFDGRSVGGSFTAEDARNSHSIVAMLQNFDFDAVCEVVGVEVTFLAKDTDPITIFLNNGLWTDRVKEWLNIAKTGDTFFFDNILVRCPGDTNPVNMGGMVMKIKD